MEPIAFSTNGAVVDVSNWVSFMLRLAVHQDGDETAEGHKYLIIKFLLLVIVMT
jgi:hypothetical protein